MRGGILVDTEKIKNKDTLQLQQMILFLKSELVKCQNEISKLKKSDYYSLVSHLEEENSQLAKQKKELSIELLKLKKAFEKEMNALHEDIQSRETQRIKMVSTIEDLVKSKKDLQTENTKLTKAIEQVHKSKPVLQQFEIDLKKSIENIDSTLQHFILNNGQQFTTIIEELEKNKNEAIDINHYLLKEIKNKNNQINMLMDEIDQLKEQLHKKPSSPFAENNTPTIDSKILSHLDTQVHAF